MKTEDCKNTEEDRVYIEHSAVLSRQEVERKLELLQSAVSAFLQDKDLRSVMREVVPTYVEPDEINFYADQSQEIQAAGQKEFARL